MTLREYIIFWQETYDSKQRTTASKNRNTALRLRQLFYQLSF